MKTQKNKQFKQIQNQAQEGRSMVEMLGVLAIIGVLSIGGIAGYRWGMDKHVSNQILNEMNLNSLQLAMLLQKGNPDGVTLALGSPYDDDNPTFRTVNYGFQYGCGDNAEVADPECEYINETRYFITALDLPERVQKMVAESAENLQYATAVETDETDGFVTVFFDVDSGVTEYESRPEETEPHYTPTPEVTTTTTTTTTEATTPETTTTEPATTTEASTTTQASTTTELTTTTTMPETTTTQPKACEDLHCGADEFCKSTGCTECRGDTITESCSTYKCESIEENSKSKKINGTTYYYKAAYMNWWSADRYCQALKAKGLVTKGTLVSLEELGCKKVTGLGACANGELLKELYATDSCAEGESCPSFSGDVWTSTPYNTYSAGFCNKYSAMFYNGDVRYGNHSDISYGALCE